MKTIKALFVLSILAVSVVHAAVETQSKPDLSTAEGRGVVMLFDDQSKPLQVIVSSTGKLAEKAGVKPNDILLRICNGARQQCEPVSSIVDVSNVTEKLSAAARTGATLQYGFLRAGQTVYRSLPAELNN